jgi:hypothetical protein
MAQFQANLMEAATAEQRMTALFEFIQFWLGSRMPNYGESEAELDKLPLPMPLRRLYEFAGRWPAEGEHPRGGVRRFSHQDSLLQLQNLKYDETGNVAFVVENQDCWTCKTFSTGDDPPVWTDDTGPEHSFCDSLSRFLITFVLQELTSGSQWMLSDDGVTNLFLAALDRGEPMVLWDPGPYVWGEERFWLWNGVLVGYVWEDYFFAANRPEAIKFLSSRQGPISRLGIDVGQWRFRLDQDGSAEVSHSELGMQRAVAPAGTFDFADLQGRLPAMVASEGHYNRNPVLFVFRDGQPGARGQHFPHQALVTDFVKRVLHCGPKRNEKLCLLFEERCLQ